MSLYEFIRTNPFETTEVFLSFCLLLVLIFQTILFFRQTKIIKTQEKRYVPDLFIYVAKPPWIRNIEKDCFKPHLELKVIFYNPSLTGNLIKSFVLSIKTKPNCKVTIPAIYMNIRIPPNSSTTPIEINVPLDDKFPDLCYQFYTSGTYREFVNIFKIMELQFIDSFDNLFSLLIENPVLSEVKRYFKHVNRLGEPEENNIK